MSKSRKQLIIVLACLALLAAVILVLAQLNKRDDLPVSGQVSLKAGDEEAALFTMEQIQAMPYVEVEKEIVSSNYANEKGLYRGVTMAELWSAAGVELEQYQQMVVTSEDGYVAVFPLDELLDPEAILLIYARDGDSLGTMADGGTGPFRILAIKDQFGTRCAKYVSELALK
ncbi:MAG: molybdopterin-dependent oxidoreductase [Firmicutes bacterium]|nr:molybdopterin-dependent oxidoreductase [Bacillota bacterium]